MSSIKSNVKMNPSINQKQISYTFTDKCETAFYDKVKLD